MSQLNARRINVILTCVSEIFFFHFCWAIIPISLTTFALSPVAAIIWQTIDSLLLYMYNLAFGYRFTRSPSIDLLGSMSAQLSSPKP